MESKHAVPKTHAHLQILASEHARLSSHSDFHAFDVTRIRPTKNRIHADFKQGHPTTQEHR
eukprot:691332-Lingulodinium_polyedra.AAC.1